MNRQTKWPAKILLNIWVLFLILLTYYAGYALGQLTGWHITFQLLAIFSLCLGFGIFMDIMGPLTPPLSTGPSLDYVLSLPWGQFSKAEWPSSWRAISGGPTLQLSS